MQGTRTRTRTHITPPWQRRMRVAPVGCLRSSEPRGAGLRVGRWARTSLTNFRAGRQRGRISLSGVFTR